jgi:hypothetical protein
LLGYVTSTTCYEVSGPDFRLLLPLAVKIRLPLGTPISSYYRIIINITIKFKLARVTKVIDVNTREMLISTTRYFTTIIINQFAITRITERVIMLFVTVIIIIITATITIS